jgi:hypothetical protein
MAGFEPDISRPPRDLYVRPYMNFVPSENCILDAYRSAGRLKLILDNRIEKLKLEILSELWFVYQYGIKNERFMDNNDIQFAIGHRINLIRETII